MKFKVNVKSFTEAIRPVFEVACQVAEKDYKYYNMITLQIKKGQIVATAYNGAASIIAPISDKNFGDIGYSCEEEGNITLTATKLWNAITSIPSGLMTMEDNGTEWTIKLEDNKDYLGCERSYSLIDEKVVPPNVGTKVDNELVINREVFVSGMDDIQFAPAYEERLHHLMCMLFEVIVQDTELIRFSAGSGGRFAVKTIEGKNIIKSGSNDAIIFPKINMPIMYKNLSQSSSDYITIRPVKADGKNNIPAQIMIEFDGMTMCIFKLDQYTKYPDLSPVMDHKYSNKIYVSLDSWKYAVGGISMVEEDFKNQIYNTQVIFEEEKSRFLVCPQTPHSISTPVSIVDDNVHTSTVQGSGKKWFRCNSRYLKELLARGGKEGVMQFNFESQEGYENEENVASMKPVLVKFDEIIDEAKEIKEQLFIFFAVSNK